MHIEVTQMTKSATTKVSLLLIVPGSTSYLTLNTRQASIVQDV